MGEKFQLISTAKNDKCILFLDKNHPENALKETIKQIKEKS
jgi:hypothetical protein